MFTQRMYHDDENKSQHCTINTLLNFEKKRIEEHL